MPRYFFDFDDGTATHHDDIGTDLPNDQVARDEASRAMGELAKEYIPGDAPQKNMTMWVRDEAGVGLLQLTLSFAVKPLL